MQNKAQYIKPDSMRLIFSNKESDPYLAFELFGRPGKPCYKKNTSILWFNFFITSGF